MQLIELLSASLKHNDLETAFDIYKQGRVSGHLSGSPFQLIANLYFSTDDKIYKNFLQKLLETDEKHLIKIDMIEYVDGIRLLNFADLYIHNGILSENYIFYPFIFEEEIKDVKEFYRIFKYNLLFISDFFNVNAFEVRKDIEKLIKNKK